MLSKNKIKFFNSLKLRKYRIKHKLFVAEGKKIVSELLKSDIEAKFIISTENDIEAEGDFEIIKADYQEIKKISFLKTAPEIIGVFKIPDIRFDINETGKSLNVFCDDIQNPGNLGTIIRTADWFGIDSVICSKNTADAFNPKTVQATMGSIASVKVFYVDKYDFFSKLPRDTDIYGTFLNGEDIFKAELGKTGVIVLGNEGGGISEVLENFVTKRLFIPHFHSNKRAESLNASVAAGIVFSEFRKR